MLASAKVAAIIPVVANAAKRCELPCSPLLIRNPHFGRAIVTKTPCPLAAVNTCPNQHLSRARCQELELRRIEAPDLPRRDRVGRHRCRKNTSEIT